MSWPEFQPLETGKGMLANYLAFRDVATGWLACGATP